MSATRVLDMGCGPGSYSARLQERGAVGDAGCGRPLGGNAGGGASGGYRRGGECGRHASAVPRRVVRRRHGESHAVPRRAHRRGGGRGPSRVAPWWCVPGCDQRARALRRVRCRARGRIGTRRLVASFPSLHARQRTSVSRGCSSTESMSSTSSACCTCPTLRPWCGSPAACEICRVRATTTKQWETLMQQFEARVERDRGDRGRIRHPYGYGSVRLSLRCSPRRR